MVAEEVRRTRMAISSRMRREYSGTGRWRAWESKLHRLVSHEAEAPEEFALSAVKGVRRSRCRSSRDIQKLGGSGVYIL